MMLKMLVVDDDPAWRALYRMAFDSHFEIFEASDGQQGLEVLHAVDPDVIVLDLRMPRMDGLDFVRRLGSRGVRGSIVVCSGALDEGERLKLPGIQLASKSPDLRDLWAALCAAKPGLTDATMLSGRAAAPEEDTFWRD
jgi:CheY-like chemotaxis protein